MNKREKQKKETLSDILHFAGDLFYSQGYEKTTIQNIASRCGLSKGALYHHFKSKEEVLERICFNHYSFLKETFLPIAQNPDASMLEKLKQIMTIARSSQMNTAAASYAKGRSQNTPSIENAAMEQLFQNYSKKIYMEIFAPLFAEGKENEECSFPMSAKVLAAFIHNLDNSAGEQINHILADKNATNPEEQLKDVIDGFVFAVSKLLNIDQQVIKDITLSDIMLKQYIEILKNDGESNV